MIEIKISLNDDEIKNRDFLTKTATYLLSLAGHQAVMVDEKEKPTRKKKNIGDRPGSETVPISMVDSEGYVHKIVNEMPEHTHTAMPLQPTLNMETLLQSESMDFGDLMTFAMSVTKSGKLTTEDLLEIAARYGFESLMKISEKPDLIPAIYNDFQKLIKERGK